MPLIMMKMDWLLEMTDMEILSYYREKDNSKELLIDHISYALEIAKRGESSKLFRFAEGIAHDFDFKKAVRLAIVFHDSGKIFYQRVKGKKGSRYISFRGHEYFSTYIFSKFAKNLARIDENFRRNDMLKFACTFSIFFHHHAMNVRLRKPDIRDEDVELGLTLLETFEKEVRRFLNHKEIEALRKSVNEIKGVKTNNLMMDLEGYINNQINAIWREMMKQGTLKKISYLSLITLITVDYLSAQQNRKTGKSIFNRVLNEFYRFYL